MHQGEGLGQASICRRLPLRESRWATCERGSSNCRLRVSHQEASGKGEKLEHVVALNSSYEEHLEELREKVFAHGRGVKFGVLLRPNPCRVEAPNVLIAMR